ncbi:hypothetical protein D7W82_06070 [Corallococcus sp. CA049B]|uniref:hypothetical protein n=1 Tax=Corallococcus sp. CA049B TaxID=2316730 RepID=UPI000EA1DCE4|nr:hypothetical protein [Corallococcus sp. CA049B]RKG89686.1 hypothetical protein D7W82_06070 [Corallococcus sp. CA049B]
MSYFDSFYVASWTIRIRTIRLKIEVHADSMASVFVNNQFVGQQPWGELEVNSQTLAETMYVDNSYLNLDSWNNSVRFDVTNFGAYTGLDYCVTVREYACT